ncbi:MAG: hypothetical protein KME46_21755 [Brasilonema angustatum HA4187-MV1]|jgi:hypothetical protein|nr:hypothetical protein [Brasilonema angustatum HA4187-MV1]
MEFSQLNERQIATILASLRLFQIEAEKYDMVEKFPDHFESGNITPLSVDEIDFLCEQINAGIQIKSTMQNFNPEDIAYVTQEFVRQDCGIYGVKLVDADCDVIIDEVKKLAQQGNFHHTGVYWIANYLAAEGRIHPNVPY